MKRGLKDFTRKKQMYGRMFILPWEIGFVLFFLQPLVQSLTFVFSEVDTVAAFESGVFVTKWNKFENIRYFLFDDSTYMDDLVGTITSFIYTIPLIVALSLIVGVLLNQKFKGRIVFRSIFFLPVIIATGVVMTYLAGDNTAQEMRGGANNGIDISNILQSMNLSANVTSTLLGFINQIFDLFWKCGVQIVLFISGLQSIPEQLYEVCRVEGANKWEEFWYVTFPMLSGTTMLVMVFTAIETFIDPTNTLVARGFKALNDSAWSDGSTVLWLYFAVVGLILALVVLLVQKKIFAKWAN